jgi:copper resistance protein C
MTSIDSSWLSRATRVTLSLLAAAVAALALALLGAAPAAAHTELVDVSPKPGERVAVNAPLTVSLTFTEAIDPAFADLVVIDAAGDVVPGRPTAVNGATVSQVLNDVPAAGAYTIRYRVVSADGHPVDGDSRFTVAAPKPRPAASSSPATPKSPSVSPAAQQPSAAEERDDVSAAASSGGTDTSQEAGGRGLVVVGGAALVLLLAGVGVVAMRRRAGSHGS